MKKRIITVGCIIMVATVLLIIRYKVRYIPGWDSFKEKMYHEYSFVSRIDYRTNMTYVFILIYLKDEADREKIETAFGNFREYITSGDGLNAFKQYYYKKYKRNYIFISIDFVLNNRDYYRFDAKVNDLDKWSITYNEKSELYIQKEAEN